MIKQVCALTARTVKKEKRQMQINRLFEILYLLLDRQQVTAKELAAHFEVSVRTIYRDIDVLSSAGVPIYTMQGTGGGIAIHDDYKIRNSMLTDEERRQILLALQSVNAVETLSTSPLLNKLKGLFQIADSDWIEIDFTRWGGPGSEQVKFEQIKDAIISGCLIRMDYISTYSGRGERIVAPVKLLYKSRAWYLKAYDQEKADFRTYRLNRILQLEVLKKSFDPEAVKGLEKVPPAETEAAPLCPVKLRCQAELGYRLYDDFFPEDITREADGTYLVTTQLTDDQWLYGFLLSFGSGLEVLEPEAIRRKLMIEAEKIVKMCKS